MLTNYYFENKYLESGGFANFCLTPLVTAVGREVTFKGDSFSWNNLTLEQHKTAHLAKRFFAGLAAIVLFPMTLVGLAARKLSSNHERWQQHEQGLIAKERKGVELAGKMQEVMGSAANTPQEKLQKAIKLGHIIDGNATHEVNKDQQKELVLELKNLLQEIVASTSVDQNLPWNPINYTLRESFKEGISFTECQNLKRLLYRLAYHERKYAFNSFQETVETSFGEFYKIVRKVYYDKFPAEHIVENLRTKGEITAVQFKIENVSEETLQEIQRAYQAPVRPDQVTFLHGTESPTVVAMASTDATLKPGCKLRQEKSTIFCGEYGVGVERPEICGGALDNMQTVLNYAMGMGIGIHQGNATTCRKFPEPSIGFYLENFTRWQEELKTGSCSDLESYGDSRIFRLNMLRDLQILATLEPRLYNEKLVPAMASLITDLQGHSFIGSQLIIKEVLQPASNFKNLPTYSAEERALIQKSHPVVFGATEIKLVKENDKDKTGKYATYAGGQTKEYLYEGTLKMGADLQFMFVPQQNVEATRRYLQQKDIRDIRVTNLESLKVAAQFQAFKAKKRERYIFGNSNYIDKPLKPVVAA